MTDRERLVEILENAGYMRQYPSTLARILLEHGLRFTPVVPGRQADDNDMCEIIFRNGEEHMREKVINLLRDARSTAMGNERIMLGDLIEKIKKIK